MEQERTMAQQVTQDLASDRQDRAQADQARLAARGRQDRMYAQEAEGTTRPATLGDPLSPHAERPDVGPEAQPRPGDPDYESFVDRAGRYGMNVADAALMATGLGGVARAVAPRVVRAGAARAVANPYGGTMATAGREAQLAGDIIRQTSRSGRAFPRASQTGHGAPADMLRQADMPTTGNPVYDWATRAGRGLQGGGSANPGGSVGVRVAQGRQDAARQALAGARAIGAGASTVAPPIQTVGAALENIPTSTEPIRPGRPVRESLINELTEAVLAKLMKK